MLFLFYIYSYIFIFLLAGRDEYAERNNQHILSDLYGKPGFEAIELHTSVDALLKVKRSYRIKYDVPPQGWFQDPPPDTEYYDSELKVRDTFGFWDDSWKRPTTDRYFLPKEPMDEDSKANFLTAPPSICVDPKLKDLLESRPLVRNQEGKKCLFLPDPIFESDKVSFKEMPLFAISQHHAKLAFANTASMAQVQVGMHDLLSWLLFYWNAKVDLSSYPGTPSPGNRVVPQMVPSTFTINQQILADLMSGKSWLFDLLSHLRDGMKLSHNGLQTSLGYNAATMIASVHAGRSQVLNNCV